MSATSIDDCQYPHIRLMSEGTFYQQHEGESYYVAAETLNHLLKCEIILEQMMKHGVCNWEEFDKCMEAVQGELK